MDVSLSDVLTCPRCGPDHGLVLLPDAVEDRRVEAGVLGCPNCRERWRIRGGEADLRVGGGGQGPESSGFRTVGSGAGGGAGDVGGREDPAIRLAGLMGLAEASGTVVVAGPASIHADRIAELVPGAVVVGIGGGPGEGSGVGGGRVSRLRVTDRLPFRSGSVRGVTLTGRYVALVEEGARVLGPAGRLVVRPASDGVAERVRSSGLRVLAAEADVLVAGRGA